MIRLCPSILNADHSQLKSEIDRVADSADMLHLDIMDKIFVPNLTFSLSESRSIIADSSLPVDTHLMIANPDELAVEYAKAGSFSVTFHYEASQQPARTLSAIRECGVRAAIAVKPTTPFSAIEGLISQLDMLLIMTVEPGFGGQAFMTPMMAKVRQARAAIDRVTGDRPWLQVDGGVSVETIALAAAAGADAFVAGSAVYKAESPKQMLNQLRALASAAQVNSTP